MPISQLQQLDLEERLVASAQDVFETMIFMTLIPEDGLCGLIEGETITGSIWFKGDVRGGISICCDMECAEEITRNMLSFDEENKQLEKHEIFDAISEVTNMVMGNMKKYLLEVFQEVEVSIPSVVDEEIFDKCWDKRSNGVEVRVTINDLYSARLMFWIQ